HTRSKRYWSSDVCSSDLPATAPMTKRGGSFRIWARASPSSVGSISRARTITGKATASTRSIIAKASSMELSVTVANQKEKYSRRSEERRVGKEGNIENGY